MPTTMRAASTGTAEASGQARRAVAATAAQLARTVSGRVGGWGLDITVLRRWGGRTFGAASGRRAARRAPILSRRPRFRPVAGGGHNVRMDLHSPAVPDATPTQGPAPLGLYLHVPFCAHKC